MHPVIQSRTRFLLTGGASILALALSLTIFVAVRRLEDQNARAAFFAAANERFDDLEINVGLTLDKLSALGGFFDASQQVDRGKFERFTAALLHRGSMIQALAWVPRVPNGLRRAFEMAAHGEGLRSFQIVDHLPSGEMVRAAERSEYFPIFLVEPLKSNQEVLGFDEASDLARNEALQRSADSGRMTATRQIAVIQPTGSQLGFLVFRPYYKDGADPSNQAARRRALAGLVLGVFRMKDVVESKTPNASAVSNLGLAVFDRDAPAGKRLLYPNSANIDGVGDLSRGGLMETRKISVAGRNWEVAAYPLPHAFSPVRWSSWSILAAEMIGVAFSVTCLYLMLSRRQAIEQTVAERTEALNAAMDKLELTKRAAEKAEKHYRKLLEVSADAILLGRNDVITMANEAARKLFRVSGIEELVGRKFIDFVAPASRAFTEEIAVRLISTELQLAQLELQLMCGGGLVDVEIAAASYLDDEGANVQSVIRDVTERKRAEETLLASEARLHGITNSAHDAILMMDPRGEITFWNPAAESIFGYRNEEAIGKNLHQFLVPERFLAAHDAAYPEFLRSGRGNAIGKTVELAARRKDGREIDVDVSLSALRLNGEWHAIGIIRDISERKRAEETLLASEARLRGITDSAHDAILMMDPRGEITFWNPAAESIFGYRNEEAIGKNLHQFLVPERFQAEHRAAYPEFLRGARGNAIGKTIELTTRRQDGREITVAASLSALLLNGEWHAICIIRDITERKQAEQARLFQHSLMRAILDASLDGILVVNNERVIESHNKMFLDVWRIPVVADAPSTQAVGLPEQTTLSPSLELIKDPESFLERIRELNKDPDANDHCEIELKDGRTVEHYSTNLWSECRQHLGRVWFFRDITERKQAEQALRDSEEKFRQLAENIREVFFVLTPSGDQVLYVSPAYEHIWGQSRECIYRNASAWREAIHPDDQEQTRGWVAKRLLGEPVDAEYRIRTPDGLEKWIWSRSFPVRGRGGELIRIVGIAEEITERKRYEEELIAAREAAEAANRAKSIFLATMSHELRTPLNAVLGFTELLELEMADRGIHDWDTDVQKIRRAGTHLLALISDVMDLSKIEAGKLELHFDTFDVAELVQEVAASVEPLAAKNRVTVQVTCEPASLYGDRVRIGQCLFNLAGNACKFTHDGSVLVEAILDKGSDRAWYTVRIVDTGIGIPPADLNKLFCDFTQLDTSHARKYEGTGLGLAISRKLSRLMGGDITAESTVGQGSTFTLRIPTGAAPDCQNVNSRLKSSSDSAMEKDTVCP